MVGRNPKLAAPLHPDERGDSGTLQNQLRRKTALHRIHLDVHARQQIAQCTRRPPRRKRRRQAVIEEYRNTLEGSGGGSQLLDIIAAVAILDPPFAAVVDRKSAV